MHAESSVHVAVGIVAHHLRPQSQPSDDVRRQCEYRVHLAVDPTIPTADLPHVTDQAEPAYAEEGMSCGLSAIPPSSSSWQFSMNCPSFDVSIQLTRPIMDKAESIHQL